MPPSQKSPRSRTRSAAPSPARGPAPTRRGPSPAGHADTEPAPPADARRPWFSPGVEALGLTAAVIPLVASTAGFRSAVAGGRVVVEMSDPVGFAAGVVALAAGVLALVIVPRTSGWRRGVEGLVALALLVAGPLHLARALGYLDRAAERSAEETRALETFHARGVQAVRAKDGTAALAAFEPACAGGHAPSCYAAGQLHAGIDEDAGAGVPRDLEKATSAWQTGCDLGDGDACANLAGVVADAARAIALGDRACQLGSAHGCHQLANEYLNGTKVAKDEARAVALYEDACGKKWAMACTELGSALAEGLGGRKVDLLRAEELWTKSCAAGHALACYNTGILHAQRTDGVPVDFKRAAAFFETGCDGGYAPACRVLATLHRDGLGVQKDTTRALALVEKACSLGDPESCPAPAPSPAAP